MSYIRRRVSPISLIPPPGSYPEGKLLKIRMSTSTKDAEILFTLDGSLPIRSTDRDHGYRCETYNNIQGYNIRRPGEHVLTIQGHKSGYVSSKVIVVTYFLEGKVDIARISYVDRDIEKQFHDAMYLRKQRMRKRVHMDALQGMEPGEYDDGKVLRSSLFTEAAYMPTMGTLSRKIVNEACGKKQSYKSGEDHCYLIDTCPKALLQKKLQNGEKITLFRLRQDNTLGTGREYEFSKVVSPNMNISIPTLPPNESCADPAVDIITSNTLIPLHFDRPQCLPASSCINNSNESVCMSTGTSMYNYSRNTSNSKKSISPQPPTDIPRGRRFSNFTATHQCNGSRPSSSMNSIGYSSSLAGSIRSPLIKDLLRYSSSQRSRANRTSPFLPDWNKQKPVLEPATALSSMRALSAFESRIGLDKCIRHDGEISEIVEYQKHNTQMYLNEQKSIGNYNNGNSNVASVQNTQTKKVQKDVCPDNELLRIILLADASSKDANFIKFLSRVPYKSLLYTLGGLDSDRYWVTIDDIMVCMRSYIHIEERDGSRSEDHNCQLTPMDQEEVEKALKGFQNKNFYTENHNDDDDFDISSEVSGHLYSAQVILIVSHYIVNIVHSIPEAIFGLLSAYYSRRVQYGAYGAECDIGVSALMFILERYRHTAGHNQEILELFEKNIHSSIYSDSKETFSNISKAGASEECSEAAVQHLCVKPSWKDKLSLRTSVVSMLMMMCDRYPVAGLALKRMNDLDDLIYSKPLYQYILL